MVSSGQINVSVANLYKEPKFQSEIVSQTLLGECFNINKQMDTFSFIRLGDGYEGWLSNYQWVEHKLSDKETVRVRSHLLRIYERPNKNAQPLRDAVIGVYLPIYDKVLGWYNIGLPDGNKGWVEKRGFGKFPTTSRTGLCQLALEFLGYPYYWGGRSPKGFDCSGLVQTVFNLVGITLPRDAWMQHRDAKLLSDEPLMAQPGDLYFFSDQGESITHVGIALGNGKILHARGLVRLNSLKEADKNYSGELHHTLVAIGTYF
jgi:hypothetical protein